LPQMDGLDGNIMRIFELYMGATGGSNNPLLSILDFIVGLVVYLALTFQCIELIHNRQPGTGESLIGGLSRFWSYLGNVLLIGFGVGLGMLIIAVPIIFLVIFVPEAYIVLLLFLLLIPAVLYLSARWIVTLPAIVAEECGPIAALRRSWDLTQGMVWRSIGFLVLTSLLGVIVPGLPTLTLTTIIYLDIGGTANPIAYGVTSALWTVAFILWYPIAMALTVFYYYDLRVRHEGYNLSLSAEQAASGLGLEPSA
jgi:membrane-anchored glycerophosphoryl diester phosphodiesterase (GDPDase)